MIKAVLVDDEILVLRLLERILGETNDILIVGAYTDPEQALIEIPKLKPDVLFLDVDMPEMNGIELGTRIIEAEANEDMAMVFVTAYEQYAIHAFKLNAIHYILKPVDPDSVDEVLKRLYQKKGIEQTTLGDGGELHFFGPAHLRVNGKNLDVLTAKIEELLALLVIHRENGISKWRIIDVLWEESSIEKSQQNLYTMMFRLKKMLKNAGIKVDIHRRNSMYTIDINGVYCDLAEFDRFLQQEFKVDGDNVLQFEQMIALYKGDLFEGKDYLWCVHEREKYYRHLVELVTSVAAYYAKEKQTHRMVKLCQQVKPILMEEDYNQLIRFEPSNLT